MIAASPVGTPGWAGAWSGKVCQFDCRQGRGCAGGRAYRLDHAATSDNREGREAVDPADCLFGEGHQAGTAQGAPVLRDRRLAGSEAAGEFAGRVMPAGEQFDDLSPGRIRDRLSRLGDGQ